MSSQEPPIDPSSATGQEEGSEPSPEEVRAYLEQLRGAPADQVVAEVASALLNAAQVKLGRRDARLLLDIVGDVTDRIRGRLPDELTDQLADVLAQLRLAQVEAEREVDQAASQGHAEAEDLPDAGDGEPSGSSTQAAEKREDAPSSAASRLWVPGN